MRPLPTGLVLATAALISLGACSVRPPPGQFGQTASVPPPAPRAEIVPPPPGPADQLVWVPGHWTWTGNGHAWEAGHYEQRPRLGAVYEAGHWQQTAAGWSWVPGYWR